MKTKEAALWTGIAIGVLCLIVGFMVLTLADPPRSKAVGTKACWQEPNPHGYVEKICGDVGLAPATAFNFTEARPSDVR